MFSRICGTFLSDKALNAGICSGSMVTTECTLVPQRKRKWMYADREDDFSGKFELQCNKHANLDDVFTSLFVSQNDFPRECAATAAAVRNLCKDDEGRIGLVFHR